MKRTVLASLELENGFQCVDFFLREGGTFGFEHYRREHDGAIRWQAIGNCAHLSFGSGEDALEAAKKIVPCLNQAEVWRW
jgi:hypothetical protein